MDAVIDSLPTYIKGFVGTLELLALSGVGALVLGTVVAAMRISPIASLRGFALVYTEILRNIPLLLVLFFCAVVLPYLKVPLDYFPLAVIGLTLYTSPFVAEAIRSGVNGVPVGQAEAARSIGLRFGQTLSLVVMPQAIRMVIPPLINVFIALVKNTSVAGAFFVYELFKAANDITNLRGDAVIALLLGVAFFYLIITVPLGLIAGWVERKVRVLR
ncbi:amino acid ABC transporter permease [Leifsonia sp. Root112D2]|jgi:glutamate transport system permease protein|uniref:amino acid ABC transporter permease n=1 Tax=Leifsonia sp. Root112D2 TaxID=1736426 RepID=UPI0006FC011F|nr:amino acid ABC transporter permease [Leifsonia sp. Root112D2]KQV05079.1 amino acid ABC transporter permease [Leifsonia sp. Root112D2]